MNQLTHNISPKTILRPNILRIAKVAKQKSRIDLRGNIKTTQRLRRKPPKLAKKNKGGGQKGNRNALKHGLYSGEMTEMKLRVRRAVADLKLAGALVRLEAARMDAETAAMRRAAERAWRLSQRLPSQPPDRSACDGAHSAPR